MANFFPNSNPAALGFIKPTAGTPLKLTANFADLENVPFKSVLIQAHPSNTGVVYVLSTSAAADKTNGTNIMSILAAGQSLPYSGIALGGINPSRVWIDVDTTGDQVIPTVYQAS